MAALTIAGCVLAAFGCSSSWDSPMPAPIPCDLRPEATTQCPSTLKCHPATTTCLPAGDVKCELNDTSDSASAGDTCTQDCLNATCASAFGGRRVCTCEGGVFVQCACLPPENWPYDDVPTAPYCDRLSGEPRYMRDDPCTGKVGQHCMSSTAPDQGCICTLQEGAVVPVWACGPAAMLGVDPAAQECESLGRGITDTLNDDPCDNEWQLCIGRNFNPEGTSPRGCVCLNRGASNTWECGATNRWYRLE